MNENSPICARLAAIVSAVASGWRKARTMRQRRDRLADHDDQHASRAPPAAARTRIDGSNSMPTETKNSTAKASRSGSVSCGGLVAELRFAQDHAGEEGAEREGHAEQLGRAEGDARARCASTARRNSSREPVWAT